MSLALSLDGIFAMTIMFTIFYNSMRSAGLYLNAASSTSSLAAIEKLTPVELTYLRDHAKTAIALSFYALSVFLWLAVIAVVAMGNVNISKRNRGVEGDGELDFSQSVVRGTYLGSLLSRRNGTRRERETLRSTTEAVVEGA
jgi:hypothetical protein